MIVGPNKGVFFIATALMYGASAFGAGSLSATDPMARIFVGEPNQLTVPPGFHEALANPPPKIDCINEFDGVGITDRQSSVADQARDAQPCSPLTAETPVPVEPAPAISAPSAKARVIAQPASAASTVER